MEQAVRKNLIVTASSIVIIGALLTLGMWFFFPDAPNRVGLAILSGMMCLCIIEQTKNKLERIAEHPIYSWILISAYTITAIMLCFPNTVVIKYALYFILVIPVASFLGSSFALTLILGILLIQTMLRGFSPELILQAFCALILCMQVSREQTKDDLKRSLAIIIVLQITLLLLFGTVRHTEGFFLDSCIMFGLFDLIAVLTLFAKNNDRFLWDVFDYNLFGENQENKADQKLTLDSDKDIAVYSLADLSKEDATYKKLLEQDIPKIAARELNTANLARKVAGIAGADTEFVYCACLYRSLLKLKPEDSTSVDFAATLKLPDRLKSFILKSENKGWKPANFEEIIVYTASELISTYNYFKKQNSEVTAEQIIESVCTLVLKKGFVRDCLLSMSLFHKMKQGFVDNLAEYLGGV